MFDFIKKLFMSDKERTRKELEKRCNIMHIVGYNFNSVETRTSEGVAFVRKGYMSDSREQLVVNFLDKHNIDYKTLSDYEIYVLVLLTTQITYLAHFDEGKNFHDLFMALYDTYMKSSKDDRKPYSTTIEKHYNYLLDDAHKLSGGNMARTINIVRMTIRELTTRESILDIFSMHEFFEGDNYVNVDDCDNDEMLFNMFIAPHIMDVKVSQYTDAVNKLFDCLFNNALEKYSSRQQREKEKV